MSKTDIVSLNEKCAESKARIAKLTMYGDSFFYIHTNDNLDRIVAIKDKEIKTYIKEISELNNKLVKLDKQTKIIEDLKLELEETKVSISKLQ